MNTLPRQLSAVVLILACGDAFARAGGGGDGFGGILLYLLYPLLLVYAAIVTWLLARKSREAKAALARAAQDPAWDHDELKSRIEYVFFKVQRAWTERDQEIARSCMSDRIYQKHKLQTDQMLQEDTRNVLEAINLSKATIVEVADFQDNAKDQLWAAVEGSMIDYTLRLRTGEVIKGRRNKAEGFSELWKFVRTPQGWVLDEIDQRMGIGDLLGMRSSAE